MKMSPMSEISSTSSTTAQRRKIKKPLIEKRRRLRINQSLANLKSLVLEATKKDENCFPKMEKADILEMTVAYMKTMKHRMPASSGPASLDNDDQMRTYLSGFQECAMQVCSFLMDESIVSVGGVELRGQLTRHLSGCFHRIEQDHKTQSLNENVEEPTKEKKTPREDRLYPSLSSSSLSPVTIPALSPLSTTTSPNFEMPRNAGVCSSGIPFHFPTVLRSPRESPRDSADARPASHPTERPSNSTATQTKFASDHSSVPFQNNCSSSLVRRHPYCRSPNIEGDEFPLNPTTMSTSKPVKVALPASDVNPSNLVHRQPIPAVDYNNSSAVWRPW